MATVVNTANLNNKLKAITTVLQRPMRDVVDLGGHILAIECARTSQPFGTGADAQLSGEKAVARDIAKVYKTPGAVYEDIVGHAGIGAGARYWKAIKQGDFERAGLIQDAYSSAYRGVPVRSFDGGAAHKAARGPNGRVRVDRPAMIVTDGRRLERYVEHVQGNVGFGKGGWADAARQIGSGSIRGLRSAGDITANWITRKAHGFGKAYRGGTDENPTVRVESAVPYASEILNGGALTTAKKIAHDKMVENLSFAVQAEMKKLRSAA